MSRGRNGTDTQVAKPALVALENLDFDRGNWQGPSKLFLQGLRDNMADHSVCRVGRLGHLPENHNVETVSESFRFFFCLCQFLVLSSCYSGRAHIWPRICELRTLGTQQSRKPKGCCSGSRRHATRSTPINNSHGLEKHRDIATTSKSVLQSANQDRDRPPLQGSQISR